MGMRKRSSRLAPSAPSSRRELIGRISLEENRYLIAIQDVPRRVLQEPLGQPAVRAEPDHLDSVAVAYSVPRRPAGQHVDVFQDRLLAEELEAVVEIRPPRGPAFGRDQAAPILFVKEP